MKFVESASLRPNPSAVVGTPMVFIVDDDVSVRESLELLIRCAGWQSQTFASAQEFLSHPRVFTPNCLILDVELPDINGLELQQQIGEDYHPPIIFLTGHGDIPSSVRAIRAGALDFLTKPWRAEESLTRREREVLPLVVGGLLNKQAAAHLGISEITLQIHRTNVMRKMAADSLADLVRMAARLDIPVTFNRRM